MERTITVRGVGNISAKPDFIVIEMNIMGQSKNYSEALADASSAVEAVCNAAVSAGHSKDALKTINFGVSSEYDSVRNSKGTYQRVFIGYNCSYNTRLSFDFDRDMLERTLNAIAESKAEPELSIRFTVRDDSAVKSALLEAAAENAREKAQILCRASGVELGRLLTVNYDWSEIDLYPPPVMQLSALLSSGRQQSRTASSPKTSKFAIPLRSFGKSCKQTPRNKLKTRRNL